MPGAAFCKALPYRLEGAPNPLLSISKRSSLGKQAGNGSHIPAEESKSTNARGMSGAAKRGPTVQQVVKAKCRAELRDSRQGSLGAARFFFEGGLQGVPAQSQGKFLAADLGCPLITSATHVEHGPLQAVQQVKA